MWGVEEGEVTAWGRDNYNQLGGGGAKPGEVLLQNIVKAIAGSEHCLALSTEGKVLAWGWNEHGSCGLEGLETVATPTHVKIPGSRPVRDIFVGAAHCFAIT